eukprot:4145981-Prymnesium_polylepis.1
MVGQDCKAAPTPAYKLSVAANSSSGAWLQLSTAPPHIRALGQTGTCHLIWATQRSGCWTSHAAATTPLQSTPPRVSTCPIHRTSEYCIIVRKSTCSVKAASGEVSSPSVARSPAGGGGLCGAKGRQGD